MFGSHCHKNSVYFQTWLDNLRREGSIQAIEHEVLLLFPVDRNWKDTREVSVGASVVSWCWFLLDIGCWNGGTFDLIQDTNEVIKKCKCLDFSNFSKTTRLMTKSCRILSLTIVNFFLFLIKVWFILKQINFNSFYAKLLVKLWCVLLVGAKSGWCLRCCEISRHIQ